MILEFPDYHCDPSKIDFTIDCIINLDKHDYPETNFDGTKKWRNKKGQRNRLDGPAVINVYGYKAYYQEGKLHRLDGPAIIYSSGKKEYWEEGKRHRLKGPAVIYADDIEEYWEYGVMIK